MPVVAIIGAGPLGRSLALAAVRAGVTVFLEDVMPANLHHAQEEIRAALGPDALPTVRFVSTVEDAVREADIVIDCVPDELESKLEIFCLIDRMAPPHTILASPITKHSITDLAACTYRADKCIAIAARPDELKAIEVDAGARPSLVLRTPPQATTETVTAVAGLFQILGFEPRVEVDSVIPDPASL
ncbi:MAG: NAD(P)-binding domain-containing protein [Acidobacteriota bacterium]|nr:NAD(P)-binding domain-containing protein [Acidobacteriota bacterium]